MAGFAVYKRKNSPFWWIWFGAGTSRQFESSGFRCDDSLGYKNAFALAKERASAVAAARKRSPVGNNWDWVEPWLRFQMPEARQAGSLKNGLRHWSFLQAFFGHEKLAGPRAINDAMAVTYATWRKANRQRQRAGLSTTAMELRLLRRVLREASRRGILLRNPLEHVKLPMPRPREKREISSEAEAAITAHLISSEGGLAVTARWMTVAWLFGIHHGWRIKETSFPLERVNFEKWEVTVESKGGRWRTIPVHPAVRGLLGELRAAAAKLSCTFPAAENPAQNASLQFIRMLKPRWPELSHHCGRVTVISRLARRGIPEVQVREFVGHWSSSSHRIYQRVAHGDLLRCIFPDDPPSAAPPNPPPQTGASDETSG